MLGRAGLVPILPKLGPRPPETTCAVKLVTWYKIRPSDWSIQKMLQSDWLVRIPPPYTTLVNKGIIIWLSGKILSLHLTHSHSGSQSQRAIWFILPTHEISHIIKNFNISKLASQIQQSSN